MIAANIRISGRLEITLRDHGPDGRSPPRRFRVIRTKNLFVASGVRQLRDLFLYPDLQGNGFTAAYVAVGSEGAPTTADMTTLGAEVFRGPITRRIPLPDGFRIELFLAPSEANGSGTQDLLEVGLFTPSTVGEIWSRAVYPVIHKNLSISVTYAWTYLLVGV